MNLDEKQKYSIDKWMETKQGTIIYPTGMGKTVVALKILKELNCSGLVIVPTKTLKTQWEKRLKKEKIKNVKVLVINSALNKEQTVDLLILDELHCYASDVRKNIFDLVNYKYLLGLTATIHRLDKKENILLEKAPIVDQVNIKEAVNDEWIQEYEEYDVLIPMSETDKKTWNMLCKEFNQLFAYFNYDLNEVLNVANNRFKYSNFNISTKKYYSMALRCFKILKMKNNFIYENPSKIEVANKILTLMSDYKTITFSESINTSKKLINGTLYHSKLSKPKRAAIEQDFLKNRITVLHTVKAFNMGVDIPDLELGIIVSGTSSNIDRTQRRGRLTRLCKTKKKPILFNLVLSGTQDEVWSNKSLKGLKVKKINLDYLSELLTNIKKGIYEVQQNYIFCEPEVSHIFDEET